MQCAVRYQRIRSAYAGAVRYPVLTYRPKSKAKNRIPAQPARLSAYAVCGTELACAGAVRAVDSGQGQLGGRDRVSDSE
eukprot:3185471-Rhodomonas_salina.2